MVMSYQDSQFCTMYDRQDDYDLDEDNEEYMEEDRDAEEQDDSDEDTEEASETDMGERKSEEYTEIKEQMYQDKLASLKKQLQQLKDGTHPEYNRKLKRLEAQYKERLRLNIIYRDYLTEWVERDYILEKKAAVKEFEEKKIDLKENLLTDMEEKRKIIESDRHTMELTGDSMEVKPVMTRKLRRRPNDPVPEKVEKRRKPPPASVNYLLEEKEIEFDLKAINRAKTSTAVRKPVLPHYNAVNISSQHISQPSETPLVETRIEDGKLSYERRWFHRGQAVYVEGKDLNRFAAHISAIGTEAIWVKKVSDSSKVRIYISQLSRGKISIKRRAS
ncbi:sin3 histone deacetylase corepressor complex component SDS3 isoform X2 [Cataglyphis hispanica]|uniref:sin3 histone deacetylase corepressor complex component SDS3 isoform X2 n=1 Tax=Cataglyphis hispanica TaxID=1086592 RepID=UPI00217F4D60|nr:sin3 histone deacetylase corepressor complex component SDS3 isoform X2 [Cataglyphis hispanica]